MVSRRLAPEEAALWAKVVESVTPLAGRGAEPPPPAAEKAGAGGSPALPPSRVTRATAASLDHVPGGDKLRRVPANTLDGSWDRRLTRGIVSPDISIDLHGHTLGGAYDTLDQGLAHAIAAGMRVVLLVTGKPRPERGGRGAIRAAVGDWLAASRHATRIAAVRGAHPRHGGQGALYIILRRERERD